VLDRHWPLAPGGATATDTAHIPSLYVPSAAALQAGLEPTLTGPGPFTFFAPNDDAMLAVTKSLGVTKVELLGLPNLGDIVKNHLLEGKILSSDLSGWRPTPCTPCSCAPPLELTSWSKRLASKRLGATA
jgi:uncharacterized surface protein with fasciclin (FAS1) repeats